MPAGVSAARRAGGSLPKWDYSLSETTSPRALYNEGTRGLMRRVFQRDASVRVAMRVAKWISTALRTLCATFLRPSSEARKAASLSFEI